MERQPQEHGGRTETQTSMLETIQVEGNTCNPGPRKVRQEAPKFKVSLGSETKPNINT